MHRFEECFKNTPNTSLAEMLKCAGVAALKAGEAIRNLYGKQHTIKQKGAIDLVTEADTASEEIILAALNDSQPGIDILSEETHSSYDKKTTGPVWIIDPLDGTTNFAHGFPWFAASIAFSDQGRTQAGVIYNPIFDEFFCACSGSGAWLNNERIRVSEAALLKDSLLATGFPYDVQQHPGPVLASLERLLVRSRGVRRAGAAALDLAYVACGRLDGFWEIKLKPWDTAAGILLVEEAGGRVSDFRGNTYTPYLPEIVATNSHIHQEMQNLLESFSLF